MKNNKPILFINSAHSNNFDGPNQYVYDSRYNKEKIIIKPEQKDILPRKVKTRNESNEKPVKEVAIGVQDQEQAKIVRDEKNNEKLLNKIELLNKRAKLSRFVLVSVTTNDEKFEGYFKEYDEDSIILSVDNSELNIEINEIEDITILKV